MVIFVIQHSNSEVPTKQHVKNSDLKNSDPLRNSDLKDLDLTKQLLSQSNTTSLSVSLATPHPTHQPTGHCSLVEVHLYYHRHPPPPFATPLLPSIGKRNPKPIPPPPSTPTSHTVHRFYGRTIEGSLIGKRVKKAADVKVLCVLASIVDVNHVSSSSFIIWEFYEMRKWMMILTNLFKISIKTLYFHRCLCVLPSFHGWLSQISGLNNVIFLQVTKQVVLCLKRKKGWSCGHSAYHHSETSLLGTIIGMAQNFVDTHHRAQFDNCIIALHSVTHEFRIMNGHIYVDAFSLLLNFHLWYILTPVRVNFIWRDVKANKLFIILIDQNREKLVAVVPQQMMRFIYGGNLLGGVFSLNHFQIEPTYAEYPRGSDREKNDDRYCWKNRQRQAKIFPLLWFNAVNFVHFISPRRPGEYNKVETICNYTNTPSDCEDLLCNKEKLYNICFSGKIGSFGYNEHFDTNRINRRRVPVEDAGSI
ncbi:unnamed protein product [Lactuca saligna]|uniref:Uncharacterized protein n=1 Tax=Lactuca saligna TaxID=75948 RepID=A0AA35YNC3_LACSI|nr:unnamed protein product [Lactuca saligna]